jgi:C4-dicarboxylate-specific signal transduction histidine kinase
MLPRLGHWLAAVLFSLGCGWGVFLISKHVGLLNLEEVAAHWLELVASAIDGVVNRLSQVPSVVELSPEVQTLFREPHNVHAASRANVYLEQLKHRLGGLELYVLNDKGVVVAASNWNQPSSFVGKRPPNPLLDRGQIQGQEVVGAAGCQRWGSRQAMSACLVVGRRAITSRRYA